MKNPFVIRKLYAKVAVRTKKVFSRVRSYLLQDAGFVSGVCWTLVVAGIIAAIGVVCILIQSGVIVIAL